MVTEVELSVLLQGAVLSSTSVEFHKCKVPPLKWPSPLSASVELLLVVEGASRRPQENIYENREGKGGRMKSWRAFMVRMRTRPSETSIQNCTKIPSPFLLMLHSPLLSLPPPLAIIPSKLVKKGESWEWRCRGKMVKEGGNLLSASGRAAA